MKTLHILTGLIAILAGFIALFSTKGSPLHRQSGNVFAAITLVMAGSGTLLAVQGDNAFTRLNTIAGVLVAYLVATGWLTVRRPENLPRWVDVLALLVALFLGVASLGFASDAAARPPTGVPTKMYVVFGTTALLAAFGDMRVLERGIEGTRRLVRHFWRMGLALWIATASLFLGQRQLFPSPLRMSGVLAIPVLVVVLAMLYWLVRVRFMRHDPRA